MWATVLSGLAGPKITPAVIVRAADDLDVTDTSFEGAVTIAIGTNVAATIGNVARARSDKSDSNPGNDIATVTITVRAD